jgi:hypothetical protein
VTTRDEDLFRLYRDELRADREATPRALAMARAVEQHLVDVLEDDAGDDQQVERELVAARRHAQHLANALKRALRIR